MKDAEKVATHLEVKAMAVRNDRATLRKRFAQWTYVFRLPYFKKAKLDFENARLIGSNGYYLQWTLRPRPNEPESYTNQQTSVGSVRLYQMRQP